MEPAEPKTDLDAVCPQCGYRGSVPCAACPHLSVSERHHLVLLREIRDLLRQLVESKAPNRKRA